MALFAAAGLQLRVALELDGLRTLPELFTNGLEFLIPQACGHLRSRRGAASWSGYPIGFQVRLPTSVVTSIDC